AAARATLARSLAIALAFGATAAFADHGDSDHDKQCPNGRDTVFVNGRIHTMDAQSRVVSTVTVHNDRFSAVGGDAGLVDNRCKQLIDLNGRTVVPGLVDNHNHILLLGLRPGYHTPLESAASFADIASIYGARIRAGVPAGQFVTTIGGFNPVQFAEKRLPTLAELDAIAPANPVYIQVSFTGPATTNSAGKTFFAGRGIAVGNDGSIAANAPTVAALNALRSIQTFDDKKRSTVDAMNYAAQLGVTSNFDMGGFLIPGSPDHDSEFTFDGAASWDPYTAYDPILELHRQGQMKTRVRVFFLSMDTQPDNPILARRVENAFREFGNDWLKIAGLGEFITNWPLFGQVVPPSNYAAAVHTAAQRGWIYQQHTLSSAEDNVAISAWEQLNTQIPIAPLHWSVAHALTITPENIQRLKTIGGGLALHGFRYLAGTPSASGPPYRTIVDSGIKVGAGSDSAQISTLNPWLMLYYMTTGKNSSGVVINPGQTLTRQEALRLYTRENGWFSKEEDKLGSIEAGKLADLVVLNGDYFSVPDESLKHLGSVLTVVGGKIVYNSGQVRVGDR
ncbi:MAG: amidohydrolase family protein, partial [Rhizobacter sp.]|nr:amidohydrolase family protein [Rhizobacter sp.]